MLVDIRRDAVLSICFHGGVLINIRRVLYYLSALMAEGRLTFAGVLYYLSDFHGGVMINIGRVVRSICLSRRHVG